METNNKQAFIQQIARENEDNPAGDKVYWSRHAILEAAQDGLTRADVETALRRATVIEDYPKLHRPLPDCLVLAWLPDERPLHAVVAVDATNERIFLITVYLPSKDRWHDDWRTRK